MKIKDGFVKCKTMDKWVVVPTGELSKTYNCMIELNETASEIWDDLKNGLSPEEIAQRFVTDYGIPLDKAANDVQKVIDRLSNENVFE